jgi:hypothetical protein
MHNQKVRAMFNLSTSKLKGNETHENCKDDSQRQESCFGSPFRRNCKSFHGGGGYHRIRPCGWG